jgi:hypothetical protein
LPATPDPWLFWRQRPALRLRWWQAIHEETDLFGEAVFAEAPSLSAPAWTATEDVPRAFADLRATWETGWWTSPDAAGRLAKAWIACGGDRIQGVVESADAFAARVRSELAACRESLRALLGGGMDILCWPENRFAPEGPALAAEAGYLATVSNAHDSLNRPGEAPERIARVFVRDLGGSPRASLWNFALHLAVWEGRALWAPCLWALRFAGPRPAGAKEGA